MILCFILICLGFGFLAFHLYLPPPPLPFPPIISIDLLFFTCDEKMELNLGKILGMLELGLGWLLTKQLPKNSHVPIYKVPKYDFKTNGGIFVWICLQALFVQD
jgi:hypothetical protein